MPDNPTTVPTAGWYTDPSDPTHERWWGGVEWTHDIRPLQAVQPPVAAQQPVFAQQPVYTAPAPVSPTAFAAPSQFSAHSAPAAEPIAPAPAAAYADPTQPAHLAQPSYPAHSAQPAPVAPVAPAVPVAPAAFVPPVAAALPAPAAALPAPVASHAAAPVVPESASAPVAAPASPFSQYQGQPVIAKPLSMADVPGGGINPFAVLDAQSTGLGLDPFGFSPPAAPASNFGSPSAFGAAPAAFGAAPAAFGAAPPTGAQPAAAAWYDEAPRGMSPDPTNGVATVGLVLSLVGLNVLGIIFSIIGLRKAREFEYAGELPVGRKRSRWGLGLGIASLIITVALVVAYIFAAQYFISLYQQQFGTSIVTTDDSDGFTVDSDDTTVIDLGAGGVSNGGISDDSYDRAAYEQGILDEYALEGYPTPDSVTCPDTGSLNEGGVVSCEIVTGGTTEIRTAEYYADGGYSISTVSTTAQ